ncbi:HAD family phosphatase [Streptococcus chenjunshii]|uniref:HAD family phosphatase n=1 Tax=Streptococcus chenjunshii TaxID=2173853 RepID=A0A372KLL8_9STRE|nr:Cof-type HAD-IIB family hydrolase [Streptococcus chenjunshii]AXQ79470.1 HAD family phosphatase [Streptococcus chenjunshii]RFU51072.1 HAD family phosphatase [Streptococcus chenjunshii]RFU53170.1 HAD family phosphatase [Streptococcus chenjunshii]
MTKKMIAIDLDGTLLHSDNTISAYTAEVIRKVTASGHIVVIATGRPFSMAANHYYHLGLKTPMISFNGALTHIPDRRWSQELSITIDKRYLFEVLNQKQAFAADFIASEYRKKFYITMDNPGSIRPELFGVKEITDKMRLDPRKITQNPKGLLMQTRHEDKYALAAEMRRYFNDEMEIDSWGGPMNILEFSARGVNKAFALKHLLNVYKLTKEELIAFGDEHNDTEMLALARTGYAMKNANPILLPYADEQLSFTSEEDGVAKQLEKLFL